jgi:hypothetical protein
MSWDDCCGKPMSDEEAAAAQLAEIRQDSEDESVCVVWTSGGTSSVGFLRLQVPIDGVGEVLTVTRQHTLCPQEL